MTAKREYTGGSVSYYKVDITDPISGNPGYTAECNDIIEALGMNYAEGNAFKAIWRSCAAKTLGISKEGYTDSLYDAEKVRFFGGRMVAIAQGEQTQPAPAYQYPETDYPYLKEVADHMHAQAALRKAQEDAAESQDDDAEKAKLQEFARIHHKIYVLLESITKEEALLHAEIIGREGFRGWPTGGMLPQEPIEDGWIEWKGGKCPLDNDVMVEYRMRDGCMHRRPAGRLAWAHDGMCSEIIAYRIAKDAA